jgi:hypothetical protein
MQVPEVERTTIFLKCLPLPISTSKMVEILEQIQRSELKKKSAKFRTTHSVGTD